MSFRKYDIAGMTLNEVLGKSERGSGYLQSKNNQGTVPRIELDLKMELKSKANFIIYIMIKEIVCN